MRDSPAIVVVVVVVSPGCACLGSLLPRALLQTLS
jgi:hypothetical protein